MRNSNYLHYCTTNNPNTCVTDEIRGEICCSECGSVLAERMIDRKAGYSSFANDQYLSNPRIKTSSMLSSYDMGTNAVISKLNKDSSGKPLSNDTKIKFKRMRIWDSRSKKNSNERRLIVGFQFLDAIKTKLVLPESITEKAAYIFRKAFEMKLSRGRAIKTIMAASIYAACRELDTPRSIDDISLNSNISRKKLSNTYRHLIKNLEIKTIPLDSKALVSKIANKVGCNEKTKRLAWKILDKAHFLKITTSKRPGGLAGAAIYLAAAINGEYIIYKQIEDASQTSSTTLRKMVRLFKNNIEFSEFMDVV